MSARDRPYTHTQFDDREFDEKLCASDRHHYVPVDPDDEEGAWVCTRCGDGDSVTEDDIR